MSCGSQKLSRGKDPGFEYIVLVQHGNQVPKVAVGVLTSILEPISVRGTQIAYNDSYIHKPSLSYKSPLPTTIYTTKNNPKPPSQNNTAY